MANTVDSLWPSILAYTVGWKEIVLLLVLFLLLFGGRKLPELARSLAKGMRIFRDELKGVKKDIEETTQIDEEPTETTEPTENTEVQSSEQEQQKET